MDNLLLTIKTPAVPYVIMESFSNKNADLLNVVNKDRKLAALHDGTLLSNRRNLKAFLHVFVTLNKIACQVVKWFIRLFTVPCFSVRLSRSSALRYRLSSCMTVKTT